VPEFCYTHLYENHRALQVSFAEDGRDSVRTIQKGLREHLLCESCEARINSYEQRFKAYWYDSPGLPRKVDLSRKALRMAGADFASTKLFHLSVLWRAGVSKWCKLVALGPYTARIAELLRTGELGPPGSFPIFGTVLVDEDGTVHHGLVTEALRSRFGHSHAYCMCYAGCEWFFIVTDHPTAEEAELSQGIDANGNLWLPYRHWLQPRSMQIALERLRRGR